MFLSGTELAAMKWLHYFPVYERYFSKFVNTDVRILEIGVLDGGSLRLWKRYFGPYARITGLDIDPDTKKYEDHQTSIFIGNQSDTALLEEVHSKSGPFDIVLDDGSHKNKDVLQTFKFFHQVMSRNSVYLIEDTHSAMLPGYKDIDESQSDIYKLMFDFCREISSGYDSRVGGEFTERVFGISFFDSIIAIEYRDPIRRLSQSIVDESSARTKKVQFPGKVG